MGKTCVICGKPTGTFVFCREHQAEKEKGLIVKCNDCGTWHYADTVCTNCGGGDDLTHNTAKRQNEFELSFTEELKSTCIICGKKSYGKKQCRDCYDETRNHMDSLDKNSTVRKLRDYYYNLKERIIIINGLEEAKKQCNKLIAIAMTDQNINDDSSLMDRVYKDVETLIANKQPIIKNEKYNEERKEKDESKSRINTAQDGHNVDSDMEVRIDDILYKSFILHSYGKSIDEIVEKRKKCDWFIPISNGKGIYIEYWGMDTPDYLRDRKEKEELYKKYNIPYIGIEKDDPKRDTQTFESNLLRELRALAIDKYGFMPEWKK